MAKKLKYIIVCKFCGRTLLNTEEPMIKLLVAETQCPDCKRILKLKEDTLIKPMSVDKTLDRPSGDKVL